ncbi:MAG: permease-like cell division protein FtsX [Lachnospiraceae bacterium]
MKFSTMGYCTKQGIINIGRNKLFSFASVLTISACIFLFGLFYSVIINVQYMINSAEENVGITVFFEDGLSEEEIKSIGESISTISAVSQVNYISAEDAWAHFQEVYFKDNPELAEGFADDNPLANSASFEIFLNNVSEQQNVVSALNAIDGIRKVNYSELAAGGLADFNRLVSIVSLLLVSILLVVSIFLISNTISLAYSVRKKEMQLMKWIGATNAFVRAPFIVEGLFIGLVGAIIPLVIIYEIYKEAVSFIISKFSIISSVIKFLPVQDVFITLIPVALILGAGIGFVGSFFTIRKQLRV